MQEKDHDADSDVVSKTRRKREMHELQALGQRLVDLNKSQLASLSLPDPLRQAVIDAHTIPKHEARRRHMQYIGRLMRSVDPTQIRAKFQEWDGQSGAHTAALHRAERWRDRFMEDENVAPTLQEFALELGARGAQVNWQALRNEVREARREREQARPPRHFRELFRQIRALMAPEEPQAATDQSAGDDDNGGDE